MQLGLTIEDCFRLLAAFSLILDFRNLAGMFEMSLLKSLPGPMIINYHA